MLISITMLMIRLQRVGRKNVATFRVVLTDSKNSTKSGKYLEVLGSYDPVNKVKEVDADRVKYWISKGAKTSETMHNFLVTKKIIEGKKVNVLPKKAKTLKRKELKTQASEKKTATPATSAVAQSAPATEAPKAEIKAPESTPVATELKTEEKVTPAETVKN